jgi:hypothetical protein
MLKLADRGLVVAYLSLPLAKFENERELVLRVFDEWKQRNARHATDIDTPEVLFLLGLADMAIQFSLSDFRRLFDLSYPYPDSTGLTFNWLYGIGVELGAVDFDPDASFRFLLHLRLHRHVYAYDGVEEKIIRDVSTSFAKANMPVNVNMSLGWPDVVVNARFRPDQLDAFVQLLTDVHSMYMVVDEKRIPVFSRVFSVIGFKWPEAPSVDHQSRMTLVRVAPGSFPIVTDRLSELHGRIHVIQGKSDLAVVADGNELPSFLEVQRQLAEDAEVGAVIQKMETHLVFNEASVLAKIPRNPVATFSERKHLGKCSCARDHAEARKEADDRTHLLPQALRHAVKNMMFLLNATITDPAMCCEVRNAVIASEKGLFRLLKKLETPPPSSSEFRTRKEHFDALRAWRDEISMVYRHITGWHTWAERILRQRTVGSFEEVLGQSDRAIAYNGGVQKFLYLADWLVNDFIKRIGNFPDDFPGKGPMFATMYDSVNTIVSVGGLGFIRLPVQRIFQFPLAVADLWHEVGVHVFYLRADYRLLPEEHKVTFGHVERLADHYGDLIVYLYGFHGDWERTMTSLLIGGIDTLRNEDQNIRAAAIYDILWRAYVVTEFDATRTGVTPDLKEVIVKSVGRVMDFVKNLRGRHASFDFQMSREAWLDINDRACGGEIELIREFFVELSGVRTHRYRRANLDAFRAGNVRAFDTYEDLNESFAACAHLIRSPDRPATKAEMFRMMAALGKSATNEYHRRQVAVGADPRPRGRVRVRP